MLLPAPRAGEVVLEHSARAVLADVEERASASDAEEGKALARARERGQLVRHGPGGVTRRPDAGAAGAVYLSSPRRLSLDVSTRIPSVRVERVVNGPTSSVLIFCAT